MRTSLLLCLLSAGLTLAACSDDSTDAPASSTSSASSSGQGGSTSAGGMGGQGADGGSGGAGEGGQAPFEVTSTAFMEGGVIPDAHTCAGANVSPPLSWTAGPAGTMSYAMIVNDVSFNFLHSAIWDIPANVTSLPENVDKAFAPANVPGAKQCPNYANAPGYAGPCPPNTHTYEFVVYALDVASLPGLDPPSGTSVMAVQTAAEQHALAVTKLTGTFTP